MRARDAYRLIVTRGGIAPAALADPERVDHVEVVEVQSGEAILFWDLAPREASQMARALREDMGRLGEDEFLARWATVGQ